MTGREFVDERVGETRRGNLRLGGGVEGKLSEVAHTNVP